jgi:hypothetical protein
MGCENCKWKKRDPDQLASAIAKFREKNEQLEKRLLNLETKVMMRLSGDSAEKSKSHPEYVDGSDGVSSNADQDFSDDDILF